MSLLKLKSIFQEEAELRTEDFIDRRPLHSNDSRFEFNVPVVGLDFANKTSLNPILDTLLIPQSSLINFEQATYDSRVPKNDGIKISNINPYKGTALDNSGANNLFTNTSNLGRDLSLSGGFEALYTSDHKPLPISSTPDPNNPFQPFNYGSNVDRGKLDIRANNSNFSIFSPSRTPLFGVGEFLGLTNDFAGEPYIVSSIGDGGRNLNNFVTMPFTHRIRMAKYLSSPDGIAFSLKENFLANNTKVQFPVLIQRDASSECYSAEMDLGGVGIKFGVGQSSLRFNASYSPASTIRNVLGQSVSTRNLPEVLLGTSGLFGGKGQTYPNIDLDVEGSFGGFQDPPLDNPNYLLSGNVTHDINKTFGDLSLPSVALDFNITSLFGAAIPNSVSDVKLIRKQSGIDDDDNATGDKMTLARMVKNVSALSSDNSTDTTQMFGPDGNEPTTDDGSKVLDPIKVAIDSRKNGMPLYFKDLRDNTYIFFRAFIEGLTENISPNWTPTNYVGRSEPVYTYERGERDISFNLKLAAQTKAELSFIYEKMNRLTSLAYPQYDTDEYLGGNKVRMKPPLTKFRLGELYGTTNDEMLGFIKSISYTVDQTSPYETEVGARVPHHINVALTYQVIHSEVPSLDTKFYGFDGFAVGVGRNF